MEEGRLIFDCPACGIRLSVDIELAGITGPCPHCEATIKAPVSWDPQMAQSQVAAQPDAPIAELPDHVMQAAAEMGISQATPDSGQVHPPVDSPEAHRDGMPPNARPEGFQDEDEFYPEPAPELDLRHRGVGSSQANQIFRA